VRGLIAVFDNSDDAYVKSRALDALDDAGVEAIRPEPGDPFDPGTQSIGGVVETVDERRHRDVIAVLRPGFRDHDTLVREAEVQIYVVRADGAERS
jgi:molecular chaperone GrpE (heat shock protein)